MIPESYRLARSCNIDFDRMQRRLAEIRPINDRLSETVTFQRDMVERNRDSVSLAP